MDRKDIRTRNIALLRQGLMRLRRGTKPQLAEATGLSVVTVNSLLQDLLAAGEVAVVEQSAATGGRPARQYRYRAERRLVLAACFCERQGRDTLSLQVVDMYGEAVASSRPLACGSVTAAFIVAQLRPYIERYPQIESVLLGLPGLEWRGRLVAMDYPDLRRAHLSEMLAAELARPVRIVNDINAAVLGFGVSLGAAASTEYIVGVYWPEHYPPGLGVLLRGELYGGRDGWTGELGSYFPVGGADDHLTEVARLLHLITCVWNPHRVALYDRRVEAAALAAALAQPTDLPQELYPAVECREDIARDYEAGLRALAHIYLGKE